MLNPSDFYFLPFKSELTQAGIASTCRSLPGLTVRGNERIYFTLRRKVASIAAKLAVYRLIEALEIPHRYVILKPFTNPDEPDLSIYGRRIECVNFLISKQKTIEHITRMPETILQAPLIVDVPEADLNLFQNDDLLLFSISLGRTTAHLSELNKIVEPGGDKYLFYPLPAQWADPMRCRSLGRLIMKSEHGPEMNVELGGRDERQVFFTHTQSLPKQVRVEIERELNSLAYLHVSELPEGRISIYSSGLKKSCTVHAHEWGNLWVYGSQIILTGYISWEEFLNRAHELAAGSLVLGEMRLPVKCRVIDAIQLYPLSDLIPNSLDHSLN